MGASLAAGHSCEFCSDDICVFMCRTAYKVENASLAVKKVWPRIIVHDIDGRDVCRAGSLRGENEILGELFPRSQAGIANLDIVTNPEAAQTNQTRDQIADFDGCAHVQQGRRADRRNWWAWWP